MEITLKINKSDKNHIDNLVKLLAKADAQLKGVEIVFSGDAMRWLSYIQKFVEDEMKKPAPIPPEALKAMADAKLEQAVKNA